jgi:hypothetical protein
MNAYTFSHVKPQSVAVSLIYEALSTCRVFLLLSAGGKNSLRILGVRVTAFFAVLLGAATTFSSL